MDEDKKTILFIGNHLSLAGKNPSVGEELSRQLEKTGWKSILVSRKRYRITRLLEMVAIIFSHRKIYSLAQVDAFSGQAFIWAYLSGKLLNGLKKPFILTLHGGNLPGFSKHHSRQINWLLNYAKVVTAPSAYLQEAMRIYRNDLILIPNALDIKRYPFIQRKILKPTLVWLRAFHEIYHPEMAIQVLCELRKNHLDARMIMAGPDKGDGSFQCTQKLTVTFELNDAVEFPGKISKKEVPEWLNKGDIFLNTTNYDNTPISVMEAMACGLCIVSTNVGGIPYLLQDNEDAILVPPNDPEAMAATVKRILTEPGLAEKLSKNARKKAEQFDWSIVLPQWEELFTEVIEKASS